MQPPAPALLWIHGGGYVFGTATQDDARCRELADELHMVVAAVEYRLAPEHPFPTPLDDCRAAFTWLANQTDVDAERVAVGGASAGGGLAASLAIAAHQRGGVRPAFQLLAYPMLDDRTITRVPRQERHARLWNSKSNRFGWTAYLAGTAGRAGVSELAAPARCVDLDGLPPAWIGVGSLDILLDEDLDYAERLRAAGVPCDTYVVDGAFHGFDAIRPTARVTREFRRAQVDALRRALCVSA